MPNTPPPARFLDHLKQRLKDSTRAAFDALWRTPVEVALGLGVAICACIAIHDSGSGAERVFARILATALPLFVAIFGVSVLHGFGAITQRARIGLTATYLGAGAIYGAFIFHPHLAAEWWRWMLISLAATCGFALLPMAVVRQKGAVREMLWTFNLRLEIHLAASLGLLFALATGLTIGAFSMKELLGVSMPGNTAAYIYAVVMFGAGPWAVAAGLPQLFLERNPLSQASRKFLAITCTYLFTPLMGLYLIILYAYQGRVLFGGMETAPSNVMSPLVLGASAMMLAGLVFNEQLRRGLETSRGVFVKLSQGLPVLFLPLMPMTAWAVWVRIEQHGWTEFRYLRLLLVACLSVIFLAAVVRWRRNETQPLGTILATFGVAALLASMGPWSALEVSKHSQTQRLLIELEAADLIIDSPHAQGPRRILRALTPQSDPHAYSISEDAASRLQYMASHFGPHAFESMLAPADFSALLEQGGKRRLTQHTLRSVLGWEGIHTPSDWESHRVRFEGPDAMAIPSQGTLYKVDISTWASSQVISQDAPAPMTLRLSSSDLSLTLAHGEVIRTSLSELVERARAYKLEGTHRHSHPAIQMEAGLRTLPLREDGGVDVGVLLIERAEIVRENSGAAFEVQSLSGYLLLTQ